MVTLGARLGEGTRSEVFELGEYRVVKLYFPWAMAKEAALREATKHASVELLRLPVPIVHGVQEFSSRWGIIYDRAPSENWFSLRHREPGVVEKAVRLQISIHERSDVFFFPHLKSRLMRKIREATHYAEPDKAELLAGLMHMPDGNRLLHGDFSLNNICGDIDNPKIIDWADSCQGDPAADACRTYLLLISSDHEDLAVEYIDRYCDLTGITHEAVLDWVPYVSAANWTMGRRWPLRLVREQAARRVSA